VTIYDSSVGFTLTPTSTLYFEYVGTLFSANGCSLYEFSLTKYNTQYDANLPCGIDRVGLYVSKTWYWAQQSANPFEALRQYFANLRLSVPSAALATVYIPKGVYTQPVSGYTQIVLAAHGNYIITPEAYSAADDVVFVKGNVALSMFQSINPCYLEFLRITYKVPGATANDLGLSLLELSRTTHEVTFSECSFKFDASKSLTAAVNAASIVRSYEAVGFLRKVRYCTCVFNYDETVPTNKFYFYLLNTNMSDDSTELLVRGCTGKVHTIASTATTGNSNISFVNSSPALEILDTQPAARDRLAIGAYITTPWQNPGMFTHNASAGIPAYTPEMYKSWWAPENTYKMSRVKFYAFSYSGTVAIAAGMTILAHISIPEEIGKIGLVVDSGGWVFYDTVGTINDTHDTMSAKIGDFIETSNPFRFTVGIFSNATGFFVQLRCNTPVEIPKSRVRANCWLKYIVLPRPTA
jgi:hypothetical protein